MKKALLSLLFGLVFAGIYLYTYKVDIGTCSLYSSTLNRENVSLPFSHRSLGNQDYTYRCTVTSKIDQTARVGIAFDEELYSIKVNDRDIGLQPLKDQYGQSRLKDWKRGYPFALSLHKGANIVEIRGNDRGGRFGLRMAQGMDYLDYLLLFLFGVVPVVYGLFMLLFPWTLRLFHALRHHRFSWRYLPYLIIAVGIALRLFYLVYVPNNMYQHDMKGHIDAIHYYADHPDRLPQPDKSLQFPQQPLYYYMAAALYSASKAFGFNEHDAIYAIRAMSVVFSIGWLLVGYRLVRLYTRRALTTNLFMAFLAFTPSFVFWGAAVNNDALNALLGMVSLYAASAYYVSKKRRFLFLASAAILLAMLTKISSLLYALYFVAVLLALYFKDAQQRRRYQAELLWFGVSVLLVFGFALLKAYIPADGEFRFVNSALYVGQVIARFNVDYFFSFHLFDLVSAAQSYVMGQNSIRFSLPTYLYGTMFLGEFDYSKRFKPGTLFMLWSQIIYIAGVVYIAGLAGYVYFFKRLNLLQKLLIVPVAINVALIVKFLLSYWVVCNSDFRYFTPTFAAVGLLFVLGLERIGVRWRNANRVIVAFAGVLAFSEIVWLASLIRLS